MSDEETPMIYRKQRVLETGCKTCMRSEVYCQCVRELDRKPCCDNCDHE